MSKLKSPLNVLRGVIAATLLGSCMSTSPYIPYSAIASGSATPSTTWSQLTQPEARRWFEEFYEASNTRPGHVPIELERYLQNLWDKIESRFPERSGVIVKVVNDSSATARATREGVILIPKGALWLVDNEDELVWLLAHEGAHLYLGHGELDDANEGLWNLQAFGATTAAILAMVDGGITAFLTAGFIASPLAATAVSGISRYRQDEERNADEIAVGIVGSLGYAQDAGSNFLSRILSFDEPMLDADAQASPVRGVRSHVDADTRIASVVGFEASIGGDGLDQTPLPWQQGVRDFSPTMERYLRRTQEIYERGLALAGQMRAEPAAIASLCGNARSFASSSLAEFPEDVDIRLMASAIHLRCSNFNAAVEPLLKDIRSGSSPGTLAASLILLSTQQPCNDCVSTANNLFRNYVRNDMIYNLNAGNWYHPGQRYVGVACEARSPEFVRIAVDVCHELGGLESCDVDDRQMSMMFPTGLFGPVCPERIMFSSSAPKGPRELLYSISWWYPTFAQ